ncbi:MAG: AAA family ATPase [Trueperaceae bacterium]|nr:AAA family ATPase [Trueperaceae bacterium]
MDSSLVKTPQRIAITGGSGAGKTTLGKHLAKRLDAVFVEVDAIQHKANWVKASKEEIRLAIYANLDGKSKWVIDNFCEREVGDYITSRADVLIWLDLPLLVKLVRLLRRSSSRLWKREVLWNGNKESLRGVFIDRDGVLIYPLRTHFKQRRNMLARLNQEKIVRLRSLKELKSWLETHDLN